MSNTLLPCPFCGGAATVGANEYYDGANTFYIYCASCGVQQMTTKIRTDEAIAAWNRRTEQESELPASSTPTNELRELSGITGELERLRAFHERYAEQTSKKYVNDICALTARAEQAEAREKAAKADMKLIADNVRETHCDETCCFACKYDCDTSINDSGEYNSECPGFYRDDCFEWRGAREGEGK